ncbi:MAG: hypothetical protein ABIW83_02475 [Allosphingosinicella sp.]
MLDVLLGAVALHVAAFASYLVAKRDNLVGPMISGHRRLPARVARPTFVSPWRMAAAPRSAPP